MPDSPLDVLRDAIDDALTVFVDTQWERAYRNTAPAALADVAALVEAAPALLRWIELVLPTTLVEGRGNDEYFDLNLRASSVWNVNHAADKVHAALEGLGKKLDP